MICSEEIGTARQCMWPGRYATCTKPSPRFIPVGDTSSHRGRVQSVRKDGLGTERAFPQNNSIPEVGKDHGGRHE